MSNLQRAIEIAVESHRGQLVKSGEPYITHPLTLMLSLQTEEEQIVAVLHDVVEDTDVTMDDLKREGFSANAIKAVELLTHESTVAYDDYIQEVGGNPLARTVKLADLRHNMDFTRLPEIQEKDLDRLKKYHRAWKYLTGLESRA